MSGYDVRVIHELRVGNGTDIFIEYMGCITDRLNIFNILDFSYTEEVL